MTIARPVAEPSAGLSGVWRARGRGAKSGLFRGGSLFAAFKELHRMSRHYGRDGVLVDELRVAVSPQQDAKIVEPGYHPLQLDAIHEKDREGDFGFTDMIEECVLQILCAFGCHGRFFRF